MVQLNEVGLSHEHPEPTCLWAPFENIVRADSENNDEIMVDVCWYMVIVQGKQWVELVSYGHMLSFTFWVGIGLQRSSSAIWQCSV